MSGAPGGNGKTRGDLAAFQAVSQRTLAKIFDVSPKSIRDWAKIGLPRNKDDTYSILDTVRWRCEYLAAVNEDAALEGSSQALKDELIRERIREKRLTNDIKESQWAPREQVAEVLGAIADLIRETVEESQRELGPEAFDFLDEKLGACALERFIKRWLPTEGEQGELSYGGNNTGGSDSKS